MLDTVQRDLFPGNRKNFRLSNKAFHPYLPFSYLLSSRIYVKLTLLEKVRLTQLYNGRSTGICSF